MLDRIKSRWWYPYLALQAVGLFHGFYPLPWHYRHTIGKVMMLPMVPGGIIGLMLDWIMRTGRLQLHGTPPLRVADDCLIGVITLTVNCSLFAVIIASAKWAARVRRNSWRKNAYTFD